MNKRKATISLILTFLILLGGLGVYKSWSGAKKSEEITQTEVKETSVLRKIPFSQLKTSTISKRVVIDGRLNAFEKVNLSANVSGILRSNAKPLKKGTYFKKGELLFDIDQRKALNNLYAQRSSLLNVVTLLMPDLKLDYPASFSQWKNYLDNFDIEKNVEVLPTFQNEREKYLIASRNIFNLFYNIKSAEAQLSDYKIYAPFSGVITQANVFPGTMVMPGQLLGELTNTAHYELESPINELDLATVKIGNKVLLRSASSDKTWNGKIVRIANQIDPMTQSIPIYIRVSGAELKEGMYLNGEVEGTKLEKVFTIPKEYIVNQNYIYTQVSSSLQLKEVVIKHKDKDHVYVTGMNSKTWIAMVNPKGLFEGQKVEPVFNTRMED